MIPKSTQKQVAAVVHVMVAVPVVVVAVAVEAADNHQFIINKKKRCREIYIFSFFVY
jgi:hypothetical protein